MHLLKYMLSEGELIEHMENLLNKCCFLGKLFFLRMCFPVRFFQKKKLSFLQEVKIFPFFFFLNSEENLDNSSPLPLSNSKATLILNVLITRAY